MSAADVLDRAADLIQAHGLHKGDYWPGEEAGVAYRPGQPCCVFGALRVAHVGAGGSHVGSNIRMTQVCPLLVSRILPFVPEYEPVLDWNDAASRTAADVVAVLRQAAAAERAA